jgi:hypothetical protein
MHTEGEISKEVDNDTLDTIWLAIMKMDVRELKMVLDEAVNYEDIGKLTLLEN